MSSSQHKPFNVKDIARAICNDIEELSVKNTPNIRAIRRKYSHLLKQENPELMIDLGRVLFKEYGHRWIACELIRNHREAFQQIGEAELKEFGVGLDSWGAVDTFAGLMSGPAWQQGQITDNLIHKWARSKDCWWRRTALVSTVVLNRKSLGGRGDVARTLEVCRLLVSDHEDMIVKAMSWALRELIVHDANAVKKFLNDYEDVLASRVKREVNNKLTTGLKNPK